MSIPAHSEPGAVPAYTAMFERAFAPDFVGTADDALPGEAPRPVKIFFRTSEPGAVIIVSGRVVAADAFVGLEQSAFSQAVPNGTFPVRLAVLQGSLGRGRVAFARVDFGSTPAVRWEGAIQDGLKRDIENPDAVFGYPVDSGLGAFFDPVAGQAARDLARQDDDVFDGWLEEGQRRGAGERGTTGGFRLDKAVGPANIVAFDSGWGDGVYASYFGFDSDGRLVALLTDFDIVDWSKVKE